MNEVQAPTREKFQDPDWTAKGERRAWVDLNQLGTLWFNTGTQCNLQCRNCYIESSPWNDSLVYISQEEVSAYLDEIEEKKMGTRDLGFTGGEPFMNKDMVPILQESLRRGYRVLVLTNAMRPMMRYQKQLLELNEQYGAQLQMRVSLDHYLPEKHAEERGARSWEPAMKGLKWLSDHEFNITAAGRTAWDETEEQMREGYAKLFAKENVRIDAYDPTALVLFPELDENAEVPEITTECWNILGVHPDDIMCADSRMVVKHKGREKPSVMACTLIAYDEEFEMGESLEEASQSVKLNHPHCAKFCVLGGGSCSKTLD